MSAGLSVSLSVLLLVGQGLACTSSSSVTTVTLGVIEPPEGLCVLVSDLRLEKTEGWAVAHPCPSDAQTQA